MINIDKLLEKPIETLFVVFFNTIQNNQSNFEIQSNYRETKFAKLSNDSYLKTAQNLSEKYKLDFVCSGSTKIISIIENNKNLNIDQFLEYIYEAIISKLNKIPKDYKLDIEMALALFIFRGSADFNHSFYSVDLKNPTTSYVDNLFKLLLSSDELLSRLNLNFRELQPQYITGKNIRNTQVRINLKWFYDNVILNFINLNKYKSDILAKNIKNLGDLRQYPSFEERIIFYRQLVFGRKLKDEEIKTLRQELQFSLQKENIPGATFINRNQKIVSYARETFKDICVGCGDKYKIEDRSFKMPRNDRYYFEINHVISYANDSDTVDVLDNLVKLCPTCHRALTPGRAYSTLQKSIIEKMINSRKEVSNFVTSMIPSNFSSPVDYVFSMLK